jgi:hypothetical protein
MNGAQLDEGAEAEVDEWATCPPVVKEVFFNESVCIQLRILYDSNLNLMLS